MQKSPQAPQNLHAAKTSEVIECLYSRLSPWDFSRYSHAEMLITLIPFSSVRSLLNLKEVIWNLTLLLQLPEVQMRCQGVTVGQKQKSIVHMQHLHEIMEMFLGSVRYHKIL